MLGTCGFENIYASDSYKVAPTPYSIACAFGSKKVQTADGERTVISITVRSASYGTEWCSNVTLGTSGEANVFSESANKVLGYLDDYFKKNPELKKDLDENKVSFWLSGFSRGGAVTNLTAKRLIDKYQAGGTKIYAYALAAPKGGIAGQELSDRDYSCIHNIINKEDIVPYVAPEEMGFKRYGVDYYTNHISDDRLKEELKKFIPANKINKYTAFHITDKTLTVEISPIFFTITKLPSFTIMDTDNHNTEALIKRVTKELCSVCSREEYVNRGLQDAFRRVMYFLNSVSDLDSVKDEISIPELVTCVISSEISDHISLSSYVTKTVRSVVDVAKDTWNFFANKKTPDLKKYIPNPVNSIKESAVNSVVDYMMSLPTIKNNIDKYEGGEFRAIDDFRLIGKTVVNAGITNLDDFITFAYNAEGIIQNHSMFQTLG